MFHLVRVLTLRYQCFKAFKLLGVRQILQGIVFCESNNSSILTLKIHAFSAANYTPFYEKRSMSKI